LEKEKLRKGTTLTFPFVHEHTVHLYDDVGYNDLDESEKFQFI